MTSLITNVNTCNQQWATRPDDQRFLSVEALYQSVKGRRDHSRDVGMALDHLSVESNEAGDIVLGSEAGSLGTLSNWSFGQLAQRASAPAGYLRSLPPELARINLQWGLERAEDTDGKILVRDPVAQNDHALVAAVNSSSYGRIFDEQLVRAVRENVDLDRWKVPGASYAATDPLRASTLYASDRDVFMFLVDEANPIEFRDGNRDTKLHRGFYVWNSEVGSGTLGVATFKYETCCDNRNLWGVGDFKELRIRHTSGGPHRFMHEARPQLRAYVEASAKGDLEAIQAAQKAIVGNNKKSVTDWLRGKGFTAAVSTRAYVAAEKDGRNPQSVWGLVAGLTDIAHDIAHTDDRIALERKAGALIEAVAA